jgi:DNA-binding NtrC family response regulator
MSIRGRILLVDDEVSIQRAVGPLLRSRGYDVESAGTGAEALRLVADRAPDLIVLDLGPTSRAPKCAAAFARPCKCRSSSCRLEVRRRTR